MYNFLTTTRKGMLTFGASIFIIFQTSAQNAYITRSEGDTTFLVKDHYIFDPNAHSQAVNSIESNSDIRIIVEFTDNPVASDPLIGTRARQIVQSAKTQHLKHITHLSNDIKNLMVTTGKQNGLLGNSSDPQVQKSFYKVFNGTSLSVPKQLLPELEKLPYIKKVHLDQQVKISINQSPQLINAPAVWTDLGIYGEGIRIGVIDTGIDYMHTDLGGGFGPGFKVAGGYDFANNDDDPIDDHYHGTHVAGIIAADGQLKGVAPKATLFALKALDQGGNGWDSDIIAAIEWTIDPNEDGDFSDRMHVVNMSLGGPGHEFSPMSLAVDQAVSMGVVFCVAAGNDGKYYTIGSPGAAKTAITVGSSTKTGLLSDFSSRGPTTNHHTKPDVLAPGSSIYSTILQNGYGYLDGTSMACPHVAGAVALILNKHPQWDVRQVKTALMSSANSVNGMNLWEQGHGIIDVFKAINSNTMIHPANISYGNIINNQLIQQFTDTIRVYNHSLTAKTYLFSVPGILPAGYSYTFNKNSLHIPAGEHDFVIFSSTFNPNSIISQPETIPYSEISISITDQVDFQQRIPVTYLKKNLLTIKFDIEPDYVIIHNHSKVIHSSSLVNQISTTISNGTYDVIAYFNNFRKLVIRENIIIEDNDLMVNIKSTDAVHKASFSTKGQNNESVPFVNLVENISYNDIGFLLGLGYAPETVVSKMDKFYSDISDKYILHLSLVSTPCMNEHNALYLYPVSLESGIYQSFSHQNKAEDVKKVVYEFNHPPLGEDLLNIPTFNHYNFSIGIIPLDCGKDAYKLEYPYKLEQYYVPSPGGDFSLNYLKNQFYKVDKDNQETDLFYLLGNLYLSTEWTALDESGAYLVSNNFKQPVNDPVTLGSTPLHVNQLISKTGNLINWPQSGPYFINNSFDFSVEPVTISVNSTYQQFSTIVNKAYFSGEMGSLELSPATDYEISVSTSQGLLESEKSMATLRGWFNSDHSFSFPSFRIWMKNGDHHQKVFGPNDQPIITVESDKESEIYIRHTGDSAWILMNTTIAYTSSPPVQQRFSLPMALQEGAYSLKLLNLQFKYEYEIKPVFKIMPYLYLDSMALVDFYHSTNGSQWKNNLNWLTAPISEWYGVTIENGRVTLLNLADNNLKGKVPANFITITALRQLILNKNHLTYLPDMSPLKQLEVLKVANNQLSFKDLLPQLFVTNFTYAPQDSVGFKNSYYLFEGDSLQLTSGEFNEDIIYKWYKNEEVLENYTTNHLLIKKVNYDDAGVYISKMTHPLLPNLILCSNKQTVTFQPVVLLLENNLGITENNSNDNGINWVDFDNDSDMDLFITKENQPNKLYKNQFAETGIPGFEVYAVPEIDQLTGAFSGSTWADYNNDGYIDFYLTTHLPTEKNYLFRNILGTGFQAIENQLLNRKTYAYSSSWGDFNNDGLVDLIVAGSPGDEDYSKASELFSNTIDHSFVPFFQSEINYFSQHASAWSDFNNDGKLDLFLGREFQHILTNTGQSFNSTKLMGDMWIQGVSIADFDNDGDMDLLTTAGKPWPKNVLYINRDHVFVPSSLIDFGENNLNSTGSAWGDYDNDGDLDIFISNTNAPNELWKNLLMESGEVSFVLETGFKNPEADSYGAAWGDYNNDGFLDLFVANREANSLFYRNAANDNNWITLTCQGVETNASAIGTKVRAKATINGKSVWQLREISASTGYASQNSLRVHFGFGDAMVIDSLIIEWPGSAKQTLTNIEVNQHLIINEFYSLSLELPQQVVMKQGDVHHLEIATVYSGSGNLTYTVTSLSSEVTVSFLNGFLTIDPGNWYGSTNITISVTDGVLSDNKTFDLLVEKNTITGLKDRSTSVFIYPNPNDGQFYLNVKGFEGKSCQVQVLNVYGELISVTSFEKLAVDFMEIMQIEASGIYLIKVLIGGEMHIKKVVIH